MWEMYTYNIAVSYLLLLCEDGLCFHCCYLIIQYLSINLAYSKFNQLCSFFKEQLFAIVLEVMLKACGFCCFHVLLSCHSRFYCVWLRFWICGIK